MPRPRPLWVAAFLESPAHASPFSMQLWTPPTPPQDDNDIYIDSVMCLMYETTPIPESKLPPVYVRKERRRHRTDPSGVRRGPCSPPAALCPEWRSLVCRPVGREAGGVVPAKGFWGRASCSAPAPPGLAVGGALARSPERPLCPAAGRKKKQRHGEAVVPPRSLFDRAAPGLLKMRREGKEQKKNLLLKQQTQFAKPLPTFAKPAAEAGPDNPEWLISEDWALLQVSPGPAPSHVSVRAPSPPPAPCVRPRADRRLTWSSRP